jgi:hypothetical protein
MDKPSLCSKEEFYQLLAKQGGKCAICGCSKRTAKDRRLAVDHDHNTGKIRGLLCSKCNTAIGMLRESLALLGAAAVYLAKHKPKS